MGLHFTPACSGKLNHIIQTTQVWSLVHWSRQIIIIWCFCCVIFFRIPLGQGTEVRGLSGVAAHEGIGSYILKLYILSLTPPKLGSLSTASQPGPASVNASSPPLPAGTACLPAALSPPKAAGCGFFISFRCLFLSRIFCFHVLPMVMEGLRCHRLC